MNYELWRIKKRLSQNCRDSLFFDVISSEVRVDWFFLDILRTPH
jgi:hypothetical protein